jgi:hypothetical protein
MTRRPTRDEIVAEAVARSDQIFEDSLRGSITRMLTCFGEDTEPKLENVDEAFGQFRAEYAVSR